MAEEDGAEVFRCVLDKARAGDLQAAGLVLSRLWQARKGRPVVLLLPEMKSAKGLSAALTIVVQAVASGEVTPDEGQAVAAVLEAQRRAIETADLELRLQVLEEKFGHEHS